MSPSMIFNVYHNVYQPGPTNWTVKVGPSDEPGGPYREFTFGTANAMSEWMRVYAKAKARQVADHVA